MKKKLLVTLMFCVCLTACTIMKQANSSGTLRTESIEIGSEKFEYFYEDYFYPAFLSVITASTWDDPEKLNPSYFVNYYTAVQYYQIPHGSETDDFQETSVEAGKLEEMIVSHFDVSVDFLRQAKEYDRNSNTYLLEYLGGAASAKIVKATQNGDILMLEFEYYSPADEVTVIRTGTLNIKITDDNFKYLSCTSNAVK